jgi:hypothetical protein
MVCVVLQRTLLRTWLNILMYRSVEKATLSALQCLLRGEHLRKPFCRCEENSIAAINNIGKEMISKIAITGSSLRIMLTEKYGISLTPANLSYFDLLCDVWKIRKQDVDGTEVYFDESKINPKLLQGLVKIANSVLEKSVAPMVEFDTVLEVKKRLTSPGVENSLISLACRISPRI